MNYNFLDDNFTTYENVETPKVTLSFPLMDSPLDISNWASKITPEGKIITTPKKIIFNNTNELSINYSQPTNYKLNSLKTDTSNKAQYARDFFMSKGMSEHSANGIVGNLMQESGLNPKAVGDKGKAFGIAQWHPDRLSGLKELAKKNGKDIHDFDTQLEYVWLELNSTQYEKALKGLFNAKNIKEATIAFMRYYEKPGDLQLEKRVKYAESI